MNKKKAKTFILKAIPQQKEKGKKINQLYSILIILVLKAEY